jgi:hypothetical protein
MTRPKLPATAAVAVTLALLLPEQRGQAQNASELETRLEAGGAMLSHESSRALGVLALTPSIRYATRRFAASASGSAWRLDDTWALRNAGASVEYYTPIVYGVRAEMLAGANRTAFDAVLQSDQVDAGGRIHYMRQRLGVWLGSGVSRPLRVAAASNVNVSSGGIWSRLGSTTLKGTVTSFFFTKVVDTLGSGGTSTATSVPVCAADRPQAVPVDFSASNVGYSLNTASSACRRESRVTDFEGSVHWQHRLIEVTVAGGQRFGDQLDVTADSRHWASARTAIWLTEKIAAVAAGGREPAQPTRGLPARSFGSLGVMLAYWPIPRGTVPVETPASLVKSFELRPAGTALQRITARIGGVETVEIMGDFTDWAPIPLVRRGRDLWELLVPMSSGVHQINLRIDGGDWIAPPGVPAIRDGFNGEVGVLVVKP